MATSLLTTTGKAVAWNPGATAVTADATSASVEPNPESGVVEADVERKDGYLKPEAAHIRYVTSNKGGHKLCVYFWPAHGEPKGVLQLTHGHGCYIAHSFLRTYVAGEPPKYEGSWIEAFNKSGWSVFGADNRGAGRSGGMRAYCERFDDYIEDGLLAARHCSQSGVPGFQDAGQLPLFLMGHSMGGCLALNMAMRTKSQGLYSGVVLMAPMLSLEKISNKGINRYLRPLNSVANWLIPTWQLVHTDKNVMYPEIQTAFDRDPLNYVARTRVRNASEYLRVTAWLQQNIDKEVDFPFIVFHSEKDTMCDVDGSKALYAKAKSADKTFKTVNHMWHLLTKELGNEELLAEIIQWLEERWCKATPPGEDANGEPVKSGKEVRAIVGVTAEAT